MSDKYCFNCKYGEVSSSDEPCNGCFGNVERPRWTPEDADDKIIPMIKSIIDEAMEKRDRTVSIYIHGDTMSVSVTPLGADEPRWIYKEDHWECSVCGAYERHATRYCANCGEALKIVYEEVKTNENQ